MSDAGFEVVSAASGRMALAAFDSEPGRFKVLVTDIRLGAGLNGWEIARHVRAVNPSMPVVYMSGDGALDWHVNGVPGSVMIAKPFVMAQVITAVASLLNASGSSVGQGN